MTKYTPTIIFDFDGTIADSWPIVANILNGFASTYKFAPLSQHKFYDIRNENIRTIVKDLGISLYKAPFLYRSIQNKLNTSLDEIAPFPGVIELIKNLHQQGYQLGLLSLSKTDYFNHFLTAYDLNTYFLFAESANKIFGKAYNLNKIINTYDIDTTKCIFIGDERKDMLASHKVGIKNIAVTWGLHSREFLQKCHPDALIDKPEQLFETIEKLLQQTSSSSQQQSAPTSRI